MEQDLLARRTGIAASLIPRIMLLDTDNPNHKRMGEKLARKIEAILELPPNWMDYPQNIVPSSTTIDEDQNSLTSIQISTFNNFTKLLMSGKLSDAYCMHLNQSWKELLDDLALENNK